MGRKEKKRKGRGKFSKERRTGREEGRNKDRRKIRGGEEKAKERGKEGDDGQNIKEKRSNQTFFRDMEPATHAHAGKNMPTLAHSRARRQRNAPNGSQNWVSLP